MLDRPTISWQSSAIIPQQWLIDQVFQVIGQLKKLPSMKMSMFLYVGLVWVL
jgi:hypothetical protein